MTVTEPRLDRLSPNTRFVNRTIREEEHLPVEVILQHLETLTGCAPNEEPHCKTPKRWTPTRRRSLPSLFPQATLAPTRTSPRRNSCHNSEPLFPENFQNFEEQPLQKHAQEELRAYLEAGYSPEASIWDAKVIDVVLEPEDGFHTPRSKSHYRDAQGYPSGSRSAPTSPTVERIERKSQAQQPSTVIPFALRKRDPAMKRCSMLGVFNWFLGKPAEILTRDEHGWSSDEEEDEDALFEMEHMQIVVTPR